MKKNVMKISVLILALCSLSACSTTSNKLLSYLPPETLALIQKDNIEEKVSRKFVSVSDMLLNVLGGSKREEITELAPSRDILQEVEETEDVVEQVAVVIPSHKPIVKKPSFTFSLAQDQTHLNPDQMKKIQERLKEDKRKSFTILCGPLGQDVNDPMEMLHAVTRGTKIAQTLQPHATSIRVQYDPTLHPGIVAIEGIHAKEDPHA